MPFTLQMMEDYSHRALYIIYVPSESSEMKNTLRNNCSGIACLIRRPKTMPRIAGNRAVEDKTQCSVVSKALRCNAIAKASVDKANNIPIA